MDITLPVVAGTMSTLIFVLSALPMLAKAYRTKDLASYSVANIALANTGNVVHSAYVFSLPPGPIWALHSFYLITTGMMLFWYVKYEARLFRYGTPRSWRTFPRASRRETIGPRTAGNEIAPESR